MGDRWNAMREPVSLEDYAMAADQRLRDLVNRPMDLSEQGKLPEIAGTTEPSQSFSRQPLGPMPRPESQAITAIAPVISQPARRSIRFADGLVQMATIWLSVGPCAHPLTARLGRSKPI
jgi:hypothetical protein